MFEQRNSNRLRTLLSGQLYTSVETADTGQLDSDGNPVNNPASGLNDGELWVRVNDPERAATIALNGVVNNQITNIPVFVGINRFTHNLEVIGLDIFKARLRFPGAVSSLLAQASGDLTITTTRGRNFKPGRIRPTSSSSVVVEVSEDWIYIDTAGALKIWRTSSGTLDLTSNIPAASGGTNQVRWVVIALNPDATTPTLTAFNGTAQLVTVPAPTVTDITSISITTGYYPLAAVLLTTGDTSIPEVNLKDWRLLFDKTGGGATFTDNITITKSDPTLIFNAGQTSDTKFWLGVQDDNGNDDDDVLQIGTGTTPGSNIKLTMSKDGDITLASNRFIYGGSAANDDISIEGTSNATKTTSYVFLQSGGGLVAIGTTSPAGTAAIEIVGTSGIIRVESVQTDATNKSANYVLGHYTNSEEPVLGFNILSASAATNLNIGGSSASFNAVTAVVLYAAANNTTTTGDEYIRIAGASTTVVINEDALDHDFRIEGNSVTHMFFCEGDSASENIALFATAVPNWQSGDREIFFANRNAAPTGNPSGGGFLYAQAGALIWRGSGGTTTTIASA